MNDTLCPTGENQHIQAWRAALRKASADVARSVSQNQLLDIDGQDVACVGDDRIEPGVQTLDNIIAQRRTTGCEVIDDISVIAQSTGHRVEAATTVDEIASRIAK